MRRLLCTLLMLAAALTALAAAGTENNIFEEGIASWYAGEFQGELTANGEIFDTEEISAAHKSLRFGTIVRVTNQINGLSVDVRINDRGPFVEGRIIDLSRAAAERIDMVERGIAPVTLEIIHMPKVPESAYRRVEDAELLMFQLGAFSTVSRALELFIDLRSLGFDPLAETSESGLLRIQLRDVPGELREEYAEKLRQAGYTDILIRSEESRSP